MGKLEEKSDGYYVLEVRIGCTAIKKAFAKSDKPLDEISSTPKADGFFLDIPDIDVNNKDVDSKNNTEN